MAWPITPSARKLLLSLGVAHSRGRFCHGENECVGDAMRDCACALPTCRRRRGSLPVDCPPKFQGKLYGADPVLSDTNRCGVCRGELLGGRVGVSGCRDVPVAAPGQMTIGFLFGNPKAVIIPGTEYLHTYCPRHGGGPSDGCFQCAAPPPKSRCRKQPPPAPYQSWCQRKGAPTTKRATEGLQDKH